MRTPLLVANWKLYKNIGEALAYAGALKDALALEEDCLRVEIAVCASHPLLHPLCEAFKGSPVAVGAQNLSEYAEGAYTGAVGINQLTGFGVRYAIIGHSERRSVFRESDEVVAAKLKIVLENGELSPILCVGEPLEVRRDAREFDFVKSQLEKALKDVEPDAAERVAVAYEPIWAIGTGVNAEPKDAEDMAKEIRYWLRDKFGIGAAHSIRILYGGSMNDKNAAELLAQPHIDGGLVGGAALKAESFSVICKAAAS